MKRKACFLPFDAEGFTGSLYLPFGQDPDVPLSPVVYLLGSEERELRDILAAGKKPGYALSRPFAMAAVHPNDWAKEYSPLQAPALRPGEPPFGDGASAHLLTIRDRLIPALEKQYPLAKGRKNRILLGYSLAGLCAFYAAFCIPDAFSRFGGVSPSLWMEGFRALWEDKALDPDVEKIYLSLGKKEPHTKNPRMACVGSEFEKSAALLSLMLPAGAFRADWNDGNHFYEPARRLARAAAFLTAP